jgi:hypothetical protein
VRAVAPTDGEQPAHGDSRPEQARGAREQLGPGPHAGLGRAGRQSRGYHREVKPDREPRAIRAGLAQRGSAPAGHVVTGIDCRRRRTAVVRTGRRTARGALPRSAEDVRAVCHRLLGGRVVEVEADAPGGSDGSQQAASDEGSTAAGARRAASARLTSSAGGSAAGLTAGAGGTADAAVVVARGAPSATRAAGPAGPAGAAAAARRAPAAGGPAPAGRPCASGRAACTGVTDTGCAASAAPARCAIRTGGAAVRPPGADRSPGADRTTGARGAPRPATGARRSGGISGAATTTHRTRSRHPAALSPDGASTAPAAATAAAGAAIPVAAADNHGESRH